MKRLSDTELCLEGYEYLDGYSGDDKIRKADRKRLQAQWSKSARPLPNGDWPLGEIEREKELRFLPPWKENFALLDDQATANEGQCTAMGYQYDHIRLARKLCIESNTEPKLYFRYLTLAGKLLKQGFTYKDEEWSF
jgi:hypothetical protein